jgi:uncharacterized MnhB-related membrane protein
MGLVFDATLLLLVLAVALWTLVARQSFAAVIGFVVYGLLLTLAWVRLGAVDVALTEAAIGAGLTGVLLIGAVRQLRGTEEAATRAASCSLPMRLLAALVAAAVVAGLAAAVLAMPDPAPTLAPQVMQNLAASGLGNPVTAVLMVFRPIDTLLEAVVIVYAVLGVWSLSPDRAWGGVPGSVQPAGPEGTLAYLARLLAPLGVVVAIYLLWVGADLPGGKFQAATVLAAMWLLVQMSGLAPPPAVSRRSLRITLVAGATIFFAIGFAGIPLAGAFLAYPEAHAKPLIVAIEVALTVSIAAALCLLLLGPATQAEAE